MSVPGLSVIRGAKSFQMWELRCHLDFIRLALWHLPLAAILLREEGT